MRVKPTDPRWAVSGIGVLTPRQALEIGLARDGHNCRTWTRASGVAELSQIVIDCAVRLMQVRRFRASNSGPFGDRELLGRALYNLSVAVDLWTESTGRPL